MAKDRKRSKGQNFSSLDAHQRQGKTLMPPLMRLPGVELLSWHEERLPEVLWAALLVRALPRDEYMRHLSLIAKTAMGFRESVNVYPEHSSVAQLSQADFQVLFATLFDDNRACAALSPLLLLQGLPDRLHWKSHVASLNEGPGWDSLAAAVLACLDRRARPAIDIRWFRVMFLCLQHRIVFPEGKGDDIVQLLCDYPEGKAESGLAEATISSMEMITTNLAVDRRSQSWSEAFWRECLHNTGCVAGDYKAPARTTEFEYESAKKRWAEIYAGLVQHFFIALRTTAVDARHDAVFGLALYAMSLVTGMMRPFSTRPSGRHLLRSLAEVYITLAYLVIKDDANLWSQYRNYGSGQAKLAFLKLVERDRKDLPRHVDISVLERLSNEDVWQEFVSIDLGQWANLTVRDMANQAGAKDAYDDFYVWPSGFVHGHWSAVRDSVYDICANPLHRFHRIPRPLRVDLEDVCFDAIDLMNRVLDLVDKAYPPFAARFDKTISGPVGPK